MKTRRPPVGLTVTEAQHRTQNTIEEAICSGGYVLVEALPGLGKSYSAIQAVSPVDLPITYLTSRHDLRHQSEAWAHDHGLQEDEVYVLPVADHECPTFRGNHGMAAQSDVRALQRRGASPMDLHRHGGLPCQKGGRCPFERRWDFRPEDYRLIVGHYKHAYLPRVVAGRAVIIDEFPEDAFLTELTDPEPLITDLLHRESALSYSDVTDVLETRSWDWERRLGAAKWSIARLTPTSTHVLRDRSGKAHALAPLAFWTLLTAEDLGNGYERAELPGGEVGVRERGGPLTILSPPDLSEASAVVALDGTPLPEMWKAVLGMELEHVTVLTEGERAAYIQDVRRLRVIQTSEYVKPYSSGRHVNVHEDAALLHEVHTLHGERPALITSKAALRQYEEAGFMGHVGECLHYGAIKGVNSLSGARVGVVAGSPHYGDGYLLKWAALLGEAVTARREHGEPGADYGPIGNRLREHMRENEVLQALLRFSRDHKGATVYVHTSALPEWVPRVEAEVSIRPRRAGERAIVSALCNRGVARTAELHAATGHDPKYIRTRLLALMEAGRVTKERDANDGRIVRWAVVPGRTINPHGEVSLPPLPEVEPVMKTETTEWPFQWVLRPVMVPGAKTKTESVSAVLRRAERPPEASRPLGGGE